MNQAIRLRKKKDFLKRKGRGSDIQAQGRGGKKDGVQVYGDWCVCCG